MLIIKKKAVFLAILLVVLFCGLTDISVCALSASCAVVYEANTGTVLYEHNADNKMLIASTTKIMTALITLENAALDETVKIPPQCERVEGSSMYLKAGEELSVRELLYGLMLESGNDAAVALAVHIAGSVETFADLMNKRAEELGCLNTHFSNPHGLDAEDHYSSAKDLALITAKALKYPEFIRIVSTKTISIGGRTFTNHNKLLWQYSGAVGVKTGYTKAAGRSLVSCAERDGVMLICVTLSDPDDWEDHTALLDEYFASCKVIKTPDIDSFIGEVEVISGEKKTVPVVPEKSEYFLIKSDSTVEYKTELPFFVYADVAKGDIAGRLAVCIDGKEEFSCNLVFGESVYRDESIKLSFWQNLLRKMAGK